MGIKRKTKGLLIGLMGLSVVITGCSKDKTTSVSEDETVYTEYKKLPSEDKAEKVKKTSYYSDVDYDGEEVPYYLFETPFQRTENYISNKELSNSITEDTLNNYIAETKSYLSVLFNKSYQNIIRDQEGFIASYEEIFPSEDVYSNAEDTENEPAFIEKLMEWYVDNRATVEAEYVTGKPLLYGDAGLYVLRGSLELRIASENNEKAISEFNDLFGSDILNENGAGCAMIESVFFPFSDSELLGVEIKALNNTEAETEQ